MKESNFLYSRNIIIILILIGLSQSILLFSSGQGDTYIHYIFAKNIAKGYWFQFNIGEFSAGSTSPLWTIILGIICKLFGENNLILLSKIISILFFLGTIVLIYYFVNLQFENKKLSILSAFLWTIYPFSSYWAATAMETLFYTFLLLLTFQVFFNILNNPTNIKFIIISIILGLLPLARPESLLLCIIIIISLFYIHKEKSFKFIIILVFPFLIILSPWYIFLYSNIHTIISHSSQARLVMARKAAINTFGIFWSFQLLFFILKYHFPIIFPFIRGITGFLKKSKYLVISHIILFFVCFYMIFFTFIFPEIYGMRYILPIMPFLFIISAYGILLCSKKLKIALITLLVLLNAFILFKYYHYSKVSPVQFRTAVWIKQNTPKDSVIAAGEVQVSYFAERKILSLDGIIDGKAILYIKNKSDMTDFLLKYKPDYILGQFIEKYWKDTIFLELTTAKKEIYKNGIEFILVYNDELEKIPVYKIYYPSSFIP